MIYCDIAVLMARKGVSIAKVSRDTSISRTTLTALRWNKFKGIQRETMDILCKYFQVQPDALFVFTDEKEETT